MSRSLYITLFYKRIVIYYDVSGIGDFENIEILKEGKVFNLDDGNFSGITKMGITLKEAFPFHL